MAALLKPRDKLQQVSSSRNSGSFRTGVTLFLEVIVPSFPACKEGLSLGMCWIQSLALILESLNVIFALHLFLNKDSFLLGISKQGIDGSLHASWTEECRILIRIFCSVKLSKANREQNKGVSELAQHAKLFG